MQGRGVPGCPGAAGQRGSVPGGSQRVPPPAARPLPRSSPGWRRNPRCADGPTAPRCSPRAALPAPRPLHRGCGGGWVCAASVRVRSELTVCSCVPPSTGPCVPGHRSPLRPRSPARCRVCQGRAPAVKPSVSGRLSPRSVLVPWPWGCVSALRPCDPACAGLSVRCRGAERPRCWRVPTGSAASAGRSPS